MISFPRIKSIFFSILDRRCNVPTLIIESDDWGSVRMFSKEAYQNLVGKGHAVDENPYHRLDGLELSEDINLLDELLSGFQDESGRKPVFTLNYLSANPDFRQIEETNFENYVRQSISLTYEEYDGHKEVISFVKQGIEKDLFEVQFHGTEHVQVTRWMKALQDKEKLELEAFREKVFSPVVAVPKKYPMEYMDALDYDDTSEVARQIDSLKIGLKGFEEVWEYTPTSFIAPCYRWSKPIEKFLSENGIKYIQGQRAQLHPKNEKGYRQRKIYHYTGQKNKYGQIYTVRNVIFEPSLHGAEKALNTAKRQIEQAFKFGNAAIVSSHRINYTSRMSVANRDQGLRSLCDLLQWVKRTYPDIRFMSSSEFGELINEKRV